VRVGLLSAGYVQDRRDDPLDAHHGIHNTLDLGAAGRFTGSEVNFLRVLGQNSTYHPLTRRVLVARTTQFGALVPYGSPRRVIPLPERFFSGGSNSHRGFPINQAGLRDLVTGFPLGGDGLLFNSVELRFPVRGEDFGGVLFHDMGNVFSEPQNVTLRFRQRPAQFDADGKVTAEDFDYMVHAVGFGVRYRTPIGPLRVDVAYSINPPRFVGFVGSREELLAGKGASAPQRISHFQFHISLGQTF
ncbi:MAG: BamA/TamA family outer membrane protein, partial [Acidobacteria bacterium]|nr:BamA/TamA family outer membrane protein [Acidobacteriota bacterium]